MKEKVLVGLASLMLLASCGGNKLEKINVVDHITLSKGNPSAKVEVNTKPNIEGLKMDYECDKEYKDSLIIEKVSESQGNYTFKFAVSGEEFKEDKFVFTFIANGVRSNTCTVAIEA